MDALGLPLKGGVHELKIGSSFSTKEGNSNSNAFHTFCYDFKPASIDQSKPAKVLVGAKDEVTVVMPNVEKSSQPTTHFRGHKRSSRKQCVLIVDHTTGEITLEKLSGDVVLKCQRLDGTSKVKSVKPAVAEKANGSSIATAGASTTTVDSAPPNLPSAAISKMKKLKKNKKSASTKSNGEAKPSKGAPLPRSTHSPSPTPPPAPSQIPPPTLPSSSTTLLPPSGSSTTLLPPSGSSKSSPSLLRLSGSSSSSSSSSSEESNAEESDVEADRKKSSAEIVKPVKTDDEEDEDNEDNNDKGSDSDEDSGDDRQAESAGVASQPGTDYSSLRDDLQLSESGSDSD